MRNEKGERRKGIQLTANKEREKPFFTLLAVSC
jgi:hypothetical protein